MLTAVTIHLNTPETKVVSPTAITQELTKAQVQPDFDRDVMVPLHQAQEKAAAEIVAQTPPPPPPPPPAAPTGSYGNNYAYHQCTWYVASRTRVPNSMGNAMFWGAGLLAAGFHSGGPVPGAIGVSQLGYAGHVVMVESVGLLTVHISEYNYVPFTYSERDVPISDFTYYYE